MDDANSVECRNEWKKEKEHFFFLIRKIRKFVEYMFYGTINIVFPSLLHIQFNMWMYIYRFFSKTKN